MCCGSSDTRRRSCALRLPPAAVPTPPFAPAVLTHAAACGDEVEVVRAAVCHELVGVLDVERANGDSAGVVYAPNAPPAPLLSGEVEERLSAALERLLMYPRRTPSVSCVHAQPSRRRASCTAFVLAAGVVDQ
jgi:hypothetical protein